MTAPDGIEVRVFAGVPLDGLTYLAIRFCEKVVWEGGSVVDLQIVDGNEGLEVHVHWKRTRA
ncbi:MAG: hypothetical protein JJU42_07145 [Rhodobacteraceae bacterium]|nr:hypothetical protein [Paracoccaceae bacterium]